MATGIEDLTKMIQDTRTSIVALDLSLTKIQDNLNLAVASGVRNTSLESQLYNCKSKIEELTEENLSVINEFQLKNVTSDAEGGLKEKSVEKCRLLSSTNLRQENPEREIRKYIIEAHALMNIVILGNIFRRLKFDDMRNVRLVCLRWKKVSEKQFWNISRIKVVGIEEGRYFCGSELDDVKEYSRRLIENFEKSFPSPGMPSNAIVFKGSIMFDTLDYFWKDRGLLTLTDVHLRRFSEPTKRCVDLNPYLGTHLTTLDIRDSDDFGSTICFFNVSFGKLPNIQKLHLENCKIILNGKIAPIELTIPYSSDVFVEGVSLIDGDNQGVQPKIFINDFVDFSKIKKLSLTGTNLKLDVSSSTPIELERLEINCLQLIGVANSLWSTKIFNFDRNEFCGERMDIRSIPGIQDTRIDFTSLPTSIKHLGFFYSVELASPQIFVYPKLTSLSILNYKYCKLPIFDFTKCTSLLSVSIVRFDEEEFDVIKLPSSITTLRLWDVCVTKQFPWPLNSLVLLKCPLFVAKNVLPHFNTTQLIISFATALTKDEDKMFIFNFWENSSIQQLVIGKIVWLDENPLSNSEFSKRVDKRGGYFLFTKTTGMGKAINLAIFKKHLWS